MCTHATAQLVEIRSFFLSCGSWGTDSSSGSTLTCLYLLDHRYLTLKVFIFRGRNSLVVSSRSARQWQPSPQFVPGHFSVAVLIFHKCHTAGVLCLVLFTGRYCSLVVLFVLWYEFRLLHFVIPTYSPWDVPCFVTPCTCVLTAVNSCFEHLCVVL